MKRIILIIVLPLLWMWFSIAATTSFEIELEKSNPEANEAIDLEITAVDEMWETVEDYQWDVIMLLEWWDFEDAEFPNEWFYEFKAEDAWYVKFSKWLIFRSEWEFEIQIEDLMNAGIAGSKTVQVWWDWQDLEFDVQIESPSQWSTLQSHHIEVIWNTDAPNTIYEVFLNWEMVRDDITDENGDFNIYIDWQDQWDKTLKVELTDSDWQVIWQSEEIDFDFEPQEEEYFKSLEISPSTEANQWEWIEFTVETSDSVESVELKIEWYEEFSMDREEAWLFKRQISINDPWTYQVDIETMADWTSENYQDVERINILEVKEIKNIKFERDPEAWNIKFEWDYEWQIPQFKFVYANRQQDVEDEQQREEEIVSTNEFLLENVDTEIDYYAKVYPLNTNWDVEWEPSQIALVEVGMMGSPSCNVSWIKISTQVINWKYYLVWDDVEGADKYEVFMADSETTNISDMEKIWETTNTKFEHPFDPESEEEIYKWYSIKANCDWQLAKIDWIEKVKVWPLSDLFLFLIIAMFVYLSYTVFTYHKQ